ncbi:DUF6114 domain-containing protein [Nocardiopsis valliformis]|uniref:DUF6114 domain-containing protein n=1 Tax=Nocardiopsis valliformis TaxID=239974 RepID=UPI00034B0E3E|nr:DUF6114 domain-containing protein [Nocardiopsis valliformis]
MAHALNPLRSGWGWFRDWRRTRPFWGGVLLIAAGIELLVAPAAQSLILPIDLIIYAGIAGVSGPLIAFLLIVLGVLSWFQPAQHVFFGLVGVMLALVSFVTSNFGGFVIGMLLGIVGGSLVFAWAPDARRRSRKRRRAAASPEDEARDGVDDDTDADAADTGSADADSDTSSTSAGDTPGTRTGTRAETPGDHGIATAETETVTDPQGGTRPLVALALPLAVAVAVASAPAPNLGWPWDWFLPGGDEEQSEEQPSEEPSDEASEEPGRGDPGEGYPEEPDDDEDTEDETDGEEEDEEEELEEDEDANPEECQLRIGDDAVTEDEEDFLAVVLACQAAQEEDEYPEVMVDSDYDCFRGSVRDSGLTADSLTMYGARYRGVVECPTADGPQRYIRLTMSRGDIRNGELWFDDLGTRRSLGLPTMNLTGDVEMHVTRMHVRLLGIPLTFTPDFPPPLLLPIMYVTGVEVDNPMASTDSMTIPNLNGQYGGTA